MSQESYLNISSEQAKLIGNALRVKILSTIIDTPRTTKQVADLLGNSPGSVHYHIKLLHEGGLIEQVKTKESGGIIEKYYQSKSKWFNSNSSSVSDPALHADYQSSDASSMNLRLFLTDEDKHELQEDFRALLEKWVAKTSSSSQQVKEYAVDMRVVGLSKENNE